jgi:hypothetical protein
MRQGGLSSIVGAVAILAAAGPAAAQGPAGFDPRVYVQPPGVGVAPPGALPGLAAQLGREAQELITATRYELAGTVQGQQVEAAARFLAGAAARLAQANGPNAADRALDEIGQAQAQIQNARAGLGGVLPRTDAAARRIDRLAYEIANLLGGGDGNGGGFVPTTGGYNPAPILRAADALSASLGAAVERIWREAGPQYPYDGAARGLDAARGQAEDLGAMAGQGTPLDGLRAAYEPIRAQVTTASRTVEGARPTPGMGQSLRDARRAMRGLEDALALNPNLVVPDRPVLIDPPAFPNLPYPVTPPGSIHPPRQLVAQIDEALALTDGFIATVQPNLLTIPEGPQFLADGRQVLLGLSALRQAAFDPAGPGALQPAMQRVLRDYDRLRRRTDKISRGRLGPNVERVLRLGDALAAIRRSLPVY